MVKGDIFHAVEFVFYIFLFLIWAGGVFFLIGTIVDIRLGLLLGFIILLIGAYGWLKLGIVQL